MKKRAYPPLIPIQQQWLRGELAKCFKSSKQVAPAAGTTPRAVTDVLNGKSGFSDVWMTAFARTMDWDEQRLRGELMDLADNPIAISARSPSLTGQRWASDEALFSDCLAGMSFLERDGTPEEMDACLDQGLQRLKDDPNDVFLRAVVSWAILRRGKPGKIVRIAKEIAAYLATTLRDTESPNIELDQEGWNRTIDKIKRGTIEEPDFVRRHLEDALMRAALLRWLQFQGKHSALAMRISGVAASQNMPLVVESLFDAAKGRREQDWVPAAIKRVYTWLDRQHTCGLGYVFLLWLTGRQGSDDSIKSVIDQTCCWIEQNPGINDSLVRWGTIWLAGMANYRVDRVFQQTRTWLRAAASEDDRLVRMSLFWLAGARGSPKQVTAAIEDGARWLKKPLYRDDGCIRVAHLVWLMRRGQERGVVTSDQLRATIAETRKWLNKHDDQLVYLGLCLAESVVQFP